jgi:DNA-binding NtrC family response regulator
LLHAADLPSALQNFVAQRKSQYLVTAAGAHGFETVTSPAKDDSLPAPRPPQSAAAASGYSSAPVSSPVIPLTELERRAIMHALDYTKGDRAVAAHLLGIGRTTLYRKLKEYDLAS